MEEIQLDQDTFNKSFPGFIGLTLIKSYPFCRDCLYGWLVYGPRLSIWMAGVWSSMSS